MSVDIQRDGVNGELDAKRISGVNGCHVEITGPGELHLEATFFENGGKIAFGGGGQIDVCVSKGVSLADGATIDVAPGTSVVMYTTGDFTAGNGLQLNADGWPKTFAVFMSDATKSNRLSVGNGSKLSAAIYAPESEVDLNQGTKFYGALIGYHVHGNHGDAVHYDVSLRDDPPAGPGQRVAVVKYWRQL